MPITEDRGIEASPSDIYEAEEANADRDRDSQVEAENHNNEVAQKEEERAEEVADAAEDTESGTDETFAEDDSATSLFATLLGSSFDAADVAIIDSQIGEVVDVEKPDGLDEPSVTTEDTGDLSDTGEDGEANELAIREYTQLRMNESFSESVFIPGSETLIDGTLKLLAKTVFRLMVTTAKLTRRGYQFAKHKALKALPKAEWATKVYKFTISRVVKNVDHERLGKRNVEAYSYGDYMTIAKYSIDLFDTVLNGHKLVFDRAAQTAAGNMPNIMKLGKGLGIEFDVPKATTDVSKLQDKRSLSLILEHGYNPSSLPNLLRYLEEMRKRMPKNSIDNVHKALADISEDISKYAAQIDDDLEKGKYTKDSKECRAATDMLVRYNSRLAFLTACTKLSTFIFAQLTDDAVAVLKIYEDCLTSKALE